MRRIKSRLALSKVALVAMLAVLIIAGVVAVEFATRSPSSKESTSGSNSSTLSTSSPDNVQILGASLSNQDFFVSLQNTGWTNVISLDGSLQPIINSINFILLETSPGEDVVNVANPVYPGEIAVIENTSMTYATFAAAPSSLTLHIEAVFSDGTSKNLTATISPNAGISGCYEYNPAFVNPIGIEYQSFTYYNGTGIGYWSVTAQNSAALPMVAFVGTLNQNSNWTSFQYDGSSVGPSNPLPPNATASLVVSGKIHLDAQGFYHESLEMVCSNGDYSNSILGIAGPPVNGTSTSTTGTASTSSAQSQSCDPPTISLGTPSISNLTVTINGATLPGNSGCSITYISWNWGDGSSSTSFFPASHTYSASGSYTITATTHESDGKTASASVTVTIG